MSRVLGVEARHDKPTRSAFDFRDVHLYQSPAVQPAGMLAVVRGPLAVRPEVAKAIARENPRLLMAVGHGDGDTMMGFDRDVLFEPGIHAPAEVAGRIVHFLACETAQKLGKKLVSQGAVAFFGYEMVVMLLDDVFDAFMESDTEIDLALLRGDTVRQAHQAAHASFDRHIGRFQAAGRLMPAALMKTHRDSLCSPVTDGSLGDPGARL
jgi:hypothetical protein